MHILTDLNPHDSQSHKIRGILRVSKQAITTRQQNIGTKSHAQPGYSSNAITIPLHTFLDVQHSARNAVTVDYKSDILLQRLQDL